MSRLSNARTIGQIERIALAPNTDLKKRRWRAGEIDCTREQHRYEGEDYAFSVTVLQLRHRSAAGALQWHVSIISERWWAVDDSHTPIKDTKWLRLMQGSATKVTAWLDRQKS